jgi:hypothetical protein
MTRKNDAFVVMIISHGRDEKILRIDYCNEVDKNDWIEISHIVHIFSEKLQCFEKKAETIFFQLLSS